MTPEEQKNIEIALEDICSIKKFTELEEDNIKTILEWLIRIQLEDKKQKTLELIKDIIN
jgi:hypothetical protein